jgi:hypothetical protein
LQQTTICFLSQNSTSQKSYSFSFHQKRLAKIILSQKGALHLIIVYILGVIIADMVDGIFL